MVKSYSFSERNEFSKKGINIVCGYLASLKKTVKILNVEANPEYQKNDIDLVWVYKKGDRNVMISIEVKTDRYTTGNLWLETISNEGINTPGCFIKSKAKYLFYYFTAWDSVYIIPLKKAKAWFIRNMHKFKESKTTTKDKNGNYKHTTIGRLVPIKTIMDQIEGIKLVKNVSRKGPKWAAEKETIMQ